MHLIFDNIKFFKGRGQKISLYLKSLNTVRNKVAQKFIDPSLLSQLFTFTLLAIQISFLSLTGNFQQLIFG